jgi:putative FmdB family regulatory protein
MPTYEYRCAKCAETFEVYQSFTDKPLKRHKGCGGDLRKVFHARGIVFKGSGFYATDMRSASESGNGSGDSGSKQSEKPAEKTSSSKSETTDKAGAAPKKPAAATKD